MADGGKSSRALRIVIVIVAVLALPFLAISLVADEPVAPGLLARCLTGEGAALLPKGGVEFESDLDGHTYSGKTDNVVDFHVYLIGAWEPHVLELMRDILNGMYAGKGVVLDIGANTGVHSMYASRYASKVIAVEPWPPVLERMNAMIKSNGIDNIAVHPVGYADKDGSLPYFQPTEHNLGAGSFSEASIEEHGETIDLPLLRGDEDLAKAGVERVDLVKIDIQGYEKPAMHGLVETLTKSRPFVIMELLVDEKEKLGFFNEQELRSVYPPNYSFFTIGEVSSAGLVVPLPGDRTFYCFDTDVHYALQNFDFTFPSDGTHRNLLAVPDEKLEEFAKVYQKH